ncbi:Do family serine endopeptidase [Candidatus Aerophobetes bacterium]|nr:Do family serine endopeptidase [Candidatus Aerophobetes bacterium]
MIFSPRKMVLIFSLLAFVTLNLSLICQAATESNLQLGGPLYEESLERRYIDPDSFEGKIISAIKKVSPAVVSISTERTVTVPGFDRDSFFGPRFEEFDEFFKRFFEQFPQREFKQRGLGSGMIINPDGYILTNEHVIKGVDRDKIMVTLSTNETHKAEIIATDAESDIAILKIEGDNFPYLIFGDSDNVQVGEWVIALGNPFGYALSELNKKYEATVTVGVISATGRAIQANGQDGGSRVYSDLIQTDASINPGNSGGSLVNIYGEVIGINAAILSPTGGSIGIGFAIPVNKAKRLLQSLTKYGEIKWPWIGIYMQELTSELAEKFSVKRGVLVADVVASSPAQEAGIKPGDIIQEVNGEPVGTPLDLKEAVLRTKIGEKIHLILIREGEKINVELYTAPRPEEVAELKVEEVEETVKAVEEKLLGIKVEELTSDLYQRYEIKKEVKGVVVTEVISGGPADRVGITTGNLIQEINKQKIGSIADFKAAMADVKPGAIVLLRVLHGSWAMFVTVETAK